MALAGVPVARRARLRRRRDRARRARDTPRLDAELLLAHALGVDRAALFLDPGREVAGAQARDASRTSCAAARRRASRSPTSLGTQGLPAHRPARSIRACSSRGRRPSSLVEAALAAAGRRARARRRDRQRRGRAGAQARAARRCRSPASDVSEDALAVARANRERLGLDVDARAGRPARRARGTTGTRSSPTRRTSPSGDRAGLPRDVRDHEPAGALFGGADGLDVVRELLRQAAATRAPLLALEVGAGPGRRRPRARPRGRLPRRRCPARPGRASSGSSSGAGACATPAELVRRRRPARRIDVLGSPHAARSLRHRWVGLHRRPPDRAARRRRVARAGAGAQRRERRRRRRPRRRGRARRPRRRRGAGRRRPRLRGRLPLRRAPGRLGRPGGLRARERPGHARTSSRRAAAPACGASSTWGPRRRSSPASRSSTPTRPRRCAPTRRRCTPRRRRAPRRSCSPPTATGWRRSSSARGSSGAAATRRCCRAWSRWCSRGASPGSAAAGTARRSRTSTTSSRAWCSPPTARRRGDAYFVTDGEPVVFRDFITELLATQGVDAPTRSVPAPVARAVAGGGRARCGGCSRCPASRR